MGASRSYDGSNDDIQITDTAVLQNIFDGGGTCAAWINASSDGENTAGRISSKNAGSSFNPTSGWSFCVRNGTTASDLDLQFLMEWSSSGYSNWRVDDVLTTGSWYYIAATYDADSTSNNATMYVDAVSQGSGTESNSPSGTRTSDAGNDLYLGNTSNADRTFDGKSCYHQLWDRILSVEELKESMVKPGSVKSGLVGYWPCLGDSPERDLSGNGNTGTISGATISNDGPPVRMF